MAASILTVRLATPEPPELSLLRRLSVAISSHLEAKSSATSDSQGKPVWIVQSVAVGSLSIALEGRPDQQASPELVDSFCNSLLRDIDVINTVPLEQLERYMELDTRILRTARALGALAIENKGTLIMEYGGRQASIGGSLVEKIDALLQARFSDWGSVEGQMETITVHRGRSFRVYPLGEARGVECRFDEEMLPAAREALGSRVIVWGRIHRSSVGSIEYIDARQLEVLKTTPLDDIRPRKPLWPGQDYKELHRWVWSG